jgi:hypothetical protein
MEALIFITGMFLAFAIAIVIVLTAKMLDLKEENEKLRSRIREINKNHLDRQRDRGNKISVQFMGINEFLQKINGQPGTDENFDERKFLVEELTRLNAKGWTKEDPIEDLRNLYDLLQ